MINTSFAEKIALDVYGIIGKAKALVGEYDKNFHLISSQGEYILKIMHPQAQSETIELQIAALEHIAKKSPDLIAPRVQRNKQHGLIEKVDAPDGQRLVWMLSYISGKLYADTRPHDAELLGSLGTVLAEFDKALLDFEHPMAKRELKWDLAKGPVDSQSSRRHSRFKTA